VTFRDFNADFVAYAERAIKAKKSVDQATKEYSVPAKFKGYTPSANPDFGGAKPNLEIAYKELGGAK
jgi:hypothetical protein